MSKLTAFSAIAMLLALFSVAPGTAQAQDKPAAAPAGAPDDRPPWVVACEPDMKKFCEAEMKANGDVRPCLAKKDTELSEACQTVFLRQYKVLEMCKDDIAKLCTEGSDGKSIKKCFTDKSDQLSDKCKGALRAGSKAHEKQQAAAAGEPAPPAAAAAKPAGKKKAKKAAE